MSVFVYRWSDTSAPTQSNVAGELIKVLDACLVNGYGSKPSAGWSKVFAGTNLAVYRAPAGRRCYLRVDDTQTYTSVNAYATMSDINTGTEPFVTESYIYSRFWKATSVTSDNTWEIYATDRSFYFISGVSYASYPTTYMDYRNMQFFGDYLCTSADFPYNTLLVTQQHSTNGWNSQIQGQQFTSGGKYIRRAWNHLLVPSTQCVFRTTGDGATIGSHGYLVYPDRLTGAMHIDRIKLMHDYTFLGYLPGLFDPIIAGTTQFRNPMSFEGSGALSGNTFYMCPIYTGNLCFQITGDWYTPIV
jgi:hypothetical protein